MKSACNKISLKGFTLFEAMLTVAILATGILFVFESFSASLSYSRLGQQMMLAANFAEEKIWEISEGNKNGRDLPAFGSEARQNQRFDWQYEITQAPEAELKALTFKVAWNAGRKEKSRTLEIFTFLPKK